MKTESTVASGLTFTYVCKEYVKKTITQTVLISTISKFRLLFIVSDFIHHKNNNRTVPNKKVRMGKNPEINKRTAYDYLDP